MRKGILTATLILLVAFGHFQQSKKIRELEKKYTKVMAYCVDLYGNDIGTLEIVGGLYDYLGIDLEGIDGHKEPAGMDEKVNRRPGPEKPGLQADSTNATARKVEAVIRY